MHYCEEETVCLVITYRSNSRDMAWGNANCNERGVAELEFINSSNLEILNQRNDPTDFIARITLVIVISLGFVGILENCKRWEVSSEPSLSDHTHILFTLDGPVPLRLRGTIRNSLREGLKGVLENGPEMNMKDDAGLGLAILSVQQALNSAY